ncbi:hypothetical protein [Nannocystis pusilla]|uniref:hypothetical protein n=1 Tax=Nannocystis pusilla TaxID=889268 RepID=UPI003B7C76E9
MESLHRERPFTSETLVEREQDLERGPRTPARTSGTPSWLRTVLQRGLAPRPGGGSRRWTRC